MLLNLQFHQSVSNNLHDLVGIGDIHGRHEVNPFGVKPFLNDEGCLRKTLSDGSFQLVYGLLHRWSQGDRTFVFHETAPPLCRTAATNVRVRRSARLAWVALTSSGR